MADPSFDDMWNAAPSTTGGGFDAAWDAAPSPAAPQRRGSTTSIMDVAPPAGEAESFGDKAKRTLVDAPADFVRAVASDPEAAASGFTKFATAGFDDNAAGSAAGYGALFQALADGKPFAQAIGDAAAAIKSGTKERRAETNAAAERSPEAYGAGAAGGTALTIPLGGAAARAVPLLGASKVAAAGAPLMESASLTASLAPTAAGRIAAAAPLAVGGAVGLGDAETLSGDARNAVIGLATAPMAGIIPGAADEAAALVGDVTSKVAGAGGKRAAENAARRLAQATKNAEDLAAKVESGKAPPTAAVDALDAIDAIVKHYDDLPDAARAGLNLGFGGAPGGVMAGLRAASKALRGVVSKAAPEAAAAVDDVTAKLDDTVLARAATPTRGTPGPLAAAADDVSAIEPPTITPTPTTRARPKVREATERPPLEPTQTRTEMLAQEPTETATMAVRRTPPPTEGLEPTEVLQRPDPSARIDFTDVDPNAEERAAAVVARPARAGPRTGAIPVDAKIADDAVAAIVRRAESDPAVAGKDGMKTFQTEVKPFMIKRPNGEELEVRAVVVSRNASNDWRPTGEIKPLRNGGAIINVSIPQGMDPTAPSVQQHIRSVLIHEMAHGADPSAASPAVAAAGRAYVNSQREVTARLAEVVDQLRSPKARAKIFWDDELPQFSTQPMDWARSASPKFAEIADSLDEPAKRRFMRAIAAAYEDARPPPSPKSSPLAEASAAPVDVAEAAPAAAARRRVTDDEARILIRDAAIANGTTDLATLSSKTGLPSSQVGRTLPDLVKNFRFRQQVAEAAKPAAPSPLAAASEVPEDVANVAERGALRDAAARSENMLAVEPEGRMANVVAATREASKWRAQFDALRPERRATFIAQKLDEGVHPERLRTRLGLTKRAWRLIKFEVDKARSR